MDDVIGWWCHWNQNESLFTLWPIDLPAVRFGRKSWSCPDPWPPIQTDIVSSGKSALLWLYGNSVIVIKYIYKMVMKSQLLYFTNKFALYDHTDLAWILSMDSSFRQGWENKALQFTDWESLHHFICMIKTSLLNSNGKIDSCNKQTKWNRSILGGCRFMTSPKIWYFIVSLPLSRFYVLLLIKSPSLHVWTWSHLWMASVQNVLCYRIDKWTHQIVFCWIILR